MNNFIPIITPRLIIRKLELEDKLQFYQYRSLKEVYQFQSFIPQSINDAEEFINSTAIYPNQPGTWFQCAICSKYDDEVIGDIGIHFLEDHFQVEIGYTLNPTYQGRGYAYEAVHAVIDYLFCSLKKHRITASTDPNNEKSINLLQKLGFRKEAHFIKSFYFNKHWYDDFVFAILNDEWKKS